MILFYHRVANHTPNDWTMTERRFAEQLRWMQANFELIGLETAQQRLQEGVNHRPAICVTFDDGYADNCEFALPLLIRDRVPVTYFVSSQFVMKGTPFPHDIAAGSPLAPNTVEQLRSLAAAGVEIGAHTRTHADLGTVTDSSQLAEEIVGGRQDLEQAIGCPVRYFAFPYGLHANLNAAGFQLAKSAGFLGVCSAYGGYNKPGDDPFHLQRIHADPELIRLKNWLSVDPRKERGAVRFGYGQQAVCQTPPLLGPSLSITAPNGDCELPAQ
jgi:peptidoglycan/xylan/chitin deacetylase (PgdA/CDA1 family)